MLRRKGGIEAKDPNAVKNTKKAADSDFQEKVRRRINASIDSDSKDQRHELLNQLSFDLSFRDAIIEIIS